MDRAYIAAAVLLAAGCGGDKGGNHTGGNEPPSSSDESCATEPLRTTGTVHYVCDCQTGAATGCHRGDDASDGLTPASPQQTLDAAVSQFNDMAAGDTVALCRGGSWIASAGYGLGNLSCTASDTCDLRDYAPSWGAGPGNPRPVITASDAFTLFSLNSDGQKGIRLWNLDTRLPGTENGDHLFVYADMHDLDVCNWSMTGGYDGINCQPTGTGDSKIAIHGNQIGSTGFTGFLGGAPGIRITNNVFEDNGLAANESVHSAYLISHCPDASYSPYCGTQENGPNSSDASQDLDYTFSNNHIRTDSYCAGVMLVVHGVFIHNKLLIENNLIETTSTDDHCYGIMLSGGNSGAHFDGVRLNRNRAFSPGNAIEVSCCDNCTASSNLAVGGQIAISSSQCTGSPSAAGTYQNNTVYLVGTSSGIVVGTDGLGPYHLDANAVWTNGTSCVEGSTQGGRNDANFCRTSGGPVATAVFTDPDNATRADANFKPPPGSPLIGAGSGANYAPTAIGSPLWDPADSGASRSPPIDAGALVH